MSKLNGIVDGHQQGQFNMGADDVIQPQIIVDDPTDINAAALILEAVIFASLTPLSLSMLQQAFDRPVSTTFIQQCVEVIRQHYTSRALALVECAQGFYFQVKADFAPIIAKLWPERPVKLSQALLETLSVIAYKQPVTRADIEYYRGVSVNSAILRQLFDRGWIAESGFRELPGRPALIVTTAEFLKAFQLKSLDQLPKIASALNVADETGLCASDEKAHV